MAVVNNVLGMLSHGVPGLVLSGLIMIMMLLGLIRKDAGLMLFGALLLIPFAYAFGGWKGARLLVRLLPILPLGSALAISKNDAIFAWTLPMPVFGYLIYVLFMIMTNGFTGISPMYDY